MSVAVGTPVLDGSDSIDVDTVTSPGHVIAGAAVSLTTKFAVQLPTLDEESVAKTVTTVVPRPTIVPAVGLWDLTGDASQLSETIAAAVKSGTAAMQSRPALAL